MHEEFIKKVTNKINKSLEIIIKFNKSIYDEMNSESFIRLNKNLFESEVNGFYKYIEELFLSYSKQIKSLGIFRSRNESIIYKSFNVDICFINFNNSFFE